MLHRDGEVLARGARARRVELASAQLERQRERIDEALAEFAENTVAHVREEADLLAGKHRASPRPGPSSATATC